MLVDSINEDFFSSGARILLEFVCCIKNKWYFCTAFESKCLRIAEIAQLVEHNLAKVGVASSSLVFRSLSNRQELLVPADLRLWVDAKEVCGSVGVGVV